MNYTCVRCTCIYIYTWVCICHLTRLGIRTDIWFVFWDDHTRWLGPITTQRRLWWGPVLWYTRGVPRMTTSHFWHIYMNTPKKTKKKKTSGDFQRLKHFLTLPESILDALEANDWTESDLLCGASLDIDEAVLALPLPAWLVDDTLLADCNDCVSSSGETLPVIRGMSLEYLGCAKVKVSSRSSSQTYWEGAVEGGGQFSLFSALLLVSSLSTLCSDTVFSWHWEALGGWLLTAEPVVGVPPAAAVVVPSLLPPIRRVWSLPGKLRDALVESLGAGTEDVGAANVGLVEESRKIVEEWLCLA